MKIQTKENVSFEDLKEVNIALWLLLNHAHLYCGANNLPFVLTSIMHDRNGIKSSSVTHQEGRAIDISVHGWSATHIERFIYHMNRSFVSIGAISIVNGKSIAALYHDAGYGAHIHLQVRPNANYSQFLFTLN